MFESICFCIYNYVSFNNVSALNWLWLFVPIVVNYIYLYLFYIC